MFHSVITGTGSYIPTIVKSNIDFTKHNFYTENRNPLDTPPDQAVEKFKQITGINERRYVTADLHAADIGALAAEVAIKDSGLNPEELDQIIVAHNFGNMSMIRYKLMLCLPLHR